MATVQPTISLVHGGVLVEWAGLALGDDGAPVQVGSFSKWSFQAAGSYEGGSRSAFVEGSNNGGVNWGRLFTFLSGSSPTPNVFGAGPQDLERSTAQGNPLNAAPALVRPVIAGDAPIECTAWLFCTP